MKIAVTSQGAGLDSPVDPRFGRCAYFVFVETDDMSFESMENSNVSLGGGAGIQSAQLMADKGVKAVVTGNVGPNAYNTLEAAGIRIMTGASGTVREAVEAFKSGGLPTAGGANVPSHSGMGGGGMGMGLGMGRGMGMGGAVPVQSAPTPLGDNVESLKAQAQSMEEQLQQLKTRIKETGPLATPLVVETTASLGRRWLKEKPVPPPLWWIRAVSLTASKMDSKESSTGRTKQAANWPNSLPAFIRVGELGRNSSAVII